MERHPAQRLYSRHAAPPPIRRLGGFAFAAFSIQLLLGASALPCVSTDHAVPGGGGQKAVSMAGMPMPDAGATEHSRDHCNEQQTTPACQSGSACAVMAVPAVALLPAAPQGVIALPISTPVTLRSALIAPDRPPPRA